MEGWLSGSRHLTRNQAYGKPYRGFESHPFRHRQSTSYVGAFPATLRFDICSPSGIETPFRGRFIRVAAPRLWTRRRAVETAGEIGERRVRELKKTVAESDVCQGRPIDQVGAGLQVETGPVRAADRELEHAVAHAL